jgi:hypothetical protein
VRDVGYGRNRGLWGILEMVEIEDCGDMDIGNGRNGGL